MEVDNPQKGGKPDIGPFGSQKSVLASRNMYMVVTTFSRHKRGKIIKILSIDLMILYDLRNISIM